MIGTILNEQELIDGVLKNKTLGGNPIQSIMAVLKHLYINEKISNRLEMKERMLSIIKSIDEENYKRIRWEKVVTTRTNDYLKSVNQNRMDKKIIYNIKDITLNKTELEKISNIKNAYTEYLSIEYKGDVDKINIELKKSNIPILEKICFIMLVYAKIEREKLTIAESQKDDGAKMSDDELDKLLGWVNIGCTNICKEARVSLNKRERERIFNILLKIGYIKFNPFRQSSGMKLLYIDNAESEDGIIINSFSDFEIVYQYLIWKGEHWRKCKECEKWIRPSNNKQEYCKRCSKESQKKYNAKKQKEYYNCKKTLKTCNSV